MRSLVKRVTYGLKLDNVYSIVPASRRTGRFEGGRSVLPTRLIATSLLRRHAWDGQE